MNNGKPKIYKRFIAYFIDILVVTLLAGLLTVIFTDTTKYNNTNKEVLEVTQQMLKDQEHADDYIPRLRELNYDLSVNSINVTIITVIISIIYFVIMPYYCHGITLGKYITKVRITSANDNELTIFNYLLRSLIINNILSNIVSIAITYSLSKNDFIKYSDKVSNVFTILLIATLIFMMYREDGRGLHDLLGNTKVVNLNSEESLENHVEIKEEIKDAQVIEEKKKVVKKKQTTKKEGK